VPDGHELGLSLGWGPVFMFDTGVKGTFMSTQPGSLSTAIPPSVEPYVDSKRAAEFLAFARRRCNDCLAREKSQHTQFSAVLAVFDGPGATS
jgi:hypothetical protein